MYQPVVLFIGLRYITGHTTDHFSRLVSWFASIGITLGMISLVIVLSIMNGFEQELKNNILDLTPQALLLSSSNSLDPKKLPKNSLNLKGVNYITPITTGDVVLQSSMNISLGIMLGIDPKQQDPLNEYMVNVKLTDLKPRKYNVILGEQLAKHLSLNQGDQLRVTVPDVVQLTPIGRLSNQRLFNVIGIFSSNREVDNYQIIVNIQDASRLMQYPYGNITGWRLWLNDPLKAEYLSHQKLPKGTKWQDWRDRKGELFQAVQMEKHMMGLLLSLIIVISCFNIVTSLSLIIMEKQSEIAILKTQGMTSKQIMVVFMVQGGSKSIIGVALGVTLGTLIANQLTNLTSIINVIANTLIIPVLPVSVEPLKIISISFAVIIIALLSTLYPSYCAATSQPAESLRYE